MMDAPMGKKIRDASAFKCKSASIWECEWPQNKNPRRSDFELLLGKSNLRESFDPLCGRYLGRYLEAIFCRLRYLGRYLSAFPKKFCVIWCVIWGFLGYGLSSSEEISLLCARYPRRVLYSSVVSASFARMSSFCAKSTVPR